MALVSAQNLTIAFGGHPLLDDATLQIERSERIGLVGRNGEGKSTLLNIVSGEIGPDDGTVALGTGVRVSLLPQDVPAGLPETVEEVIASGLPRHAQGQHHIQRQLSLMELDPGARFHELSGGQKRRALLGRALVEDPDVLLLDEPTNHLDLESIEWLEGFLKRFAGSLLFVTHDRAFLQALATRIVELDRGALTSWACGYRTYLERKEEQLRAEEKRWAEFDRKLSEEEAWIRKNIKARRTRNEGRVRALQAMRKERRKRRERVGEVRMNIQEAERSGTRVIVAKGVSFGYGDEDAGDEGTAEPLIRDFSTTIMRGDKIGIIGPNGVGKTTLIQLLLDRLQPDAGTVEHGTSLQVRYFDQHREELDEAETVAEAVGFGSDHVEIDGERRHVMSYLQDFLFTAERARQPIRSLSGGERNRLLLARLFTRPANVLVLDEPTNDLDTETLELLESRLVSFSGTVLTVSHDRAFLDNLCTNTFVFEGGGRVKEYVGGYSDWKRAVARRTSEDDGDEEGESGQRKGGDRARSPKSGTGAKRPKKLTYNDQRELERLPGTIEKLEAELAEAHEALADPELYKRDPEAVSEVTRKAEALERKIEEAFDRWAELSERAG
ncbi:MAG: ATP-binding cassette domain-containing protein [Gemmatimonadota bacterium]|nr:ATP-binding cassette domain-containing protein [Gemmatimonadota bacterium]